MTVATGLMARPTYCWNPHILSYTVWGPESSYVGIRTVTHLRQSGRDNSIGLWDQKLEVTWKNLLMWLNADVHKSLGDTKFRVRIRLSVLQGCWYINLFTHGAFGIRNKWIVILRNQNFVDQYGVPDAHFGLLHIKQTVQYLLHQLAVKLMRRCH